MTDLRVDDPLSRRIARPLRIRQPLTQKIGKISGLALAGLLVATMFSQGGEMMRSWYSFIPVCLILCANSIFPFYERRWPRIEPFSYPMLAFVMIGAVSVAASALDLYPNLPLLPRRSDYVLRQSYFLFLFLPFIIGGYHIWSVGLPSVIGFAKRFGIAVLVLLPILDLGTGYFYGTFQDFHIFYLDTVQTGFIYFIIFAFYVVFTEKPLLPLVLMAAALLACRWSHYGMLFNSLGSLIMFVILVILCMSRMIGRARGWLVTALVPLALVVMTVEISVPALCHDQEQDASVIFAHPGNTSFRCEAWRSNMQELFATYLVGVGYGTPYFPFTNENSQSAKFFKDQMGIPASEAATDVLYIRGQHSSLINAFYRLGAIGGGVFLLMNWVLMIKLARAAAADGLLGRLSLVACGLTVLTFFKVISNVGLESPRLLINYTLAISLALVCMEAVPVERRRRPVESSGRARSASAGRGRARPGVHW